MSVSNIEVASQHYQNAFDLKVVDSEDSQPRLTIQGRAEQSPISARTELLRGVNGQLRLMQFTALSIAARQAPRSEVNGTGFTHLCMQVKHKTGAYNKFIDGGGTPIGAPEMVQLNPKNPIYYAYARDRDNVMFEIEHVDVEKLDLPTPPKNDYRLRHIAIATPDINRAVKFYSTLFETKNPRRLGRFIPLKGENFDKVSGFNNSRLKMAFFQVRNMEFEVAEYLSHPPDKPKMHRPIDALGYNMVVFDVSSLSQAKAAIFEAGGTLETESLAIDGEKIMFARDQDGNLLGFQESTPDSALSSVNFVGNGI